MRPVPSIFGGDGRRHEGRWKMLGIQPNASRALAGEGFVEHHAAPVGHDGRYAAALVQQIGWNWAEADPEREHQQA
jgi:hypothetical protein